MTDTKVNRVLRAGQPVDVDTEQTLLAYLPFYVENVEAERYRHALRCLSNLAQFHSIPSATVSCIRRELPEAPQAAEPPKMSSPTKKWARAHWLLRPVWKHHSIISQRQKRKNSSRPTPSPVKSVIPARLKLRTVSQNDFAGRGQCVYSRYVPAASPRRLPWEAGACSLLFSVC